ncbi:MAG: hypothetical protein E7056_05370 [Lentisphaerae bacterium]|nr:hypothetical protein [Lentisphaerota bacterium]
MKFAIVSALMTICFLGICSTNAETELVKNAKWSKLAANGVPESWENRVTGSNSFSVTQAATGNVLKLTVKDPAKTAFFMYRNLPLEAGKRYTVSYEVKGSADGKYLLYCEWQRQAPDAAKAVLQSYNTRLQSVSGEWKKLVFTFTFPQDCRMAYMVLMAKQGEIEFRNLSFTPAK